MVDAKQTILNHCTIDSTECIKRPKRRPDLGVLNQHDYLYEINTTNNTYNAPPLLL